MKSKCLACSSYRKDGNKNYCLKNPLKVIYGEIRFDMKFIKHCSNFVRKEGESNV